MLNWHPSSREDVVDDGVIYRVVDNALGQYALWPLDESLPRGWFDCRVAGDKAFCLSYVNEVWTDLRRAPDRYDLLAPLAAEALVATTSFSD
jgi:MbtH protein